MDKSNHIKYIGEIIEKKTKQPLELATVIILNSKGNIITGATTNEKGFFSIETNAGVYNVKFEFIGFKNKTINDLELNQDFKIETIVLEEDETQLETVEVVAEKSTIEYKLDKKVFNVGKDLISISGSANDLLNNVPSVSVSPSGEISLRGSTGVKILINGKPSSITANNGLEQIASVSIEKVEVITNPSSKYEASGTAGIINIILKKNKKGGFSGALQLTTGTPTNNAINTRLSYKTKKFNFFSSINHQNRTYFGEGYYNKTTTENNVITSVLDRTTDSKRNYKSYSIYVGSDFYFNKKNTITLSYNYNNSDNNTNVDYQFKFFDTPDVLNTSFIATEIYEEPQIAHELELDYVKTFDKKGRKLTASLKLDFWNDDENALISEQQELPALEQELILKSNNVESSKDVFFQSDYSTPLFEKSKLEFGIKGEIRRIKSDYTVSENDIVIDDLNNILDYNEDIYGIYAQYGNRENKFQYALGLRMEHSKTGSIDTKEQFDIEKIYTKLFPTVHLTYQFTDKTSMQLSYSKRIRRPSFYHLNPFGGISDRRNLRIGNPDLKPMYTDSFEFGFLRRWNKFTFNPSIYYKHYVDFFSNVTINNEDGILTTQTVNLGIDNLMGLELVGTYSPYKWWRISSELNYYTFKQNGMFNDRKYNAEDTTWEARLNSRIKYKKITFQTSFRYNGASFSGETNSASNHSLNTAVSTSLFKDKASLNFNIDNILDSRISNQTIYGNNYNVINNSKSYGRRLSLTFAYKFDTN